MRQLIDQRQGEGLAAGSKPKVAFGSHRRTPRSDAKTFTEASITEPLP